MQLKNFLSFSAAALVLTACGNVDFKKTKSDVPYKIFSEGKGEKLQPNYIVKFEVIQKLKDSVLFSTYNQGVSQYLQIPAGGTADSKSGSYADIRGNILEIFSQSRKGDSIYIVQKVDSLLKVNPQLASDPMLKKGGEIVTTVRVVDFYKTTAEADAAVTKERMAMVQKSEKESFETFQKDTAAQRQMGIDNKIIEEYLAANKINAQKTQWGVYTQVINPGQGPKPTAGQFVQVQYRGTNLQGQEFDKGVFPLQVGTGGSIKGFEEGISQFGKGGKGKIFIPSRLGYGPRGMEPKILPNQILVFDIEIKDITDKQPAPEAQMPVDTSAH